MVTSNHKAMVSITIKGESYPVMIGIINLNIPQRLQNGNQVFIQRKHSLCRLQLLQRSGEGRNHVNKKYPKIQFNLLRDPYSSKPENVHTQMPN